MTDQDETPWRQHELKCWPSPFRAMRSGRKTFEYRLNDRGFRLADTLLLKEWDPEKREYTGEEDVYVVTYILSGPKFGIPEGYSVMSVRPANG